jgi:hypothetical protein
VPGTTFSLAVTGKVVELGDGAVELQATQVRLWPGSRLIKQDGLRIRLEADINSADESVAMLLAPSSPLSRGKTATVFTSAGKVTFAAQTGAAGTLAATRIVLRPT